MIRSRFVCLSLALAILAAACGPAVLEPSNPQPLPSPADPQPLPSPAGSWAVILTQTGGFAGVSLKVTVTSDGELTAEDQRAGRTVTQKLSPEMTARLDGLYAAMAAVTPQPLRSTCADCFNYDLQMNSGGGSVNLKADDTTLDSSGAAELVRLLVQLRDEAFKSQP